MSILETQKFLSNLKTNAKLNSDKLGGHKQKEVVGKRKNFSERIEAERDKILLRKKKIHKSKKDKLNRRKEGRKQELSAKKIEKLKLLDQSLLEKNLKFINTLKKKARVKQTVVDKIIGKIRK
jgi:hypothetical protein